MAFSSCTCPDGIGFVNLKPLGKNSRLFVQHEDELPVVRASLLDVQLVRNRVKGLGFRARRKTEHLIPHVHTVIRSSARACS